MVLGGEVSGTIAPVDEGWFNDSDYEASTLLRVRPSAGREVARTRCDLDPAEPGFEVVNLPTNLRLPKHRLAFRLTHRFARSLGEDDFSDLLADLFGFDSGAQIGLGLRFGLFRGTGLGLYRTSDRTIQLELRQELARESRSPVVAERRNVPARVHGGVGAGHVEGGRDHALSVGLWRGN